MATYDSGTFGALLRRQRLAAGLTQEALAERAGLSAKAVSDLERDPARTPRLGTVTLLADALGRIRSGVPSCSRRPGRPPARPRPCRRRRDRSRNSPGGSCRGRSPR